MRVTSRSAVAAIGYTAFLLIGWSALLVPSMIRLVEGEFVQNDAGIGVFYFAYASAYAAGSLAGGVLTEHLGRRGVLFIAGGLHGAGLLALGAAPTWSVFLVAGLPAALGAGALDGGISGLFLDLYPAGRGGALNRLHLFFGIGALICPVSVGLLVDGGIPWQKVLMATSVVALLVAALIAISDMPPGLLAARGLDQEGRVAAVSRIERWLVVLLAIAITTYVAAEIGVSNWLVRFLESAQLVASAGLSLFWASLAAGRLLSSRIADRLDPRAFTASSAALASSALLGAVLVPSVPLSIGLFALAGLFFGPIFPMIIAIGGDRYPLRPAAISGLLTGVAIVGSVVYPPIMGFMSVAIGLQWAMLGTVVMATASATALVLIPRLDRRLA